MLKGGQQFPWDVHLEEMEKESVPPKSKPSVPQTILENDVILNEEERSSPPNIPQTILGKDGAPMVLIPAGDFQMGSGPGYHFTPPLQLPYIQSMLMRSIWTCTR